MDVFFIYILFSIIILIYNYICYRNSKVLYTINKRKFYILNSKYYLLQFRMWNIIAIIFALIAILELLNLPSYMAAIFLIIATLSFWGINFLLQTLSERKEYIKYK